VAAAEFTMCEAPSVEHLAGDLSLAFILYQFPFAGGKGKRKIFISSAVHRA